MFLIPSLLTAERLKKFPTFWFYVSCIREEDYKPQQPFKVEAALHAVMVRKSARQSLRRENEGIEREANEGAHKKPRTSSSGLPSRAKKATAKDSPYFKSSPNDEQDSNESSDGEQESVYGDKSGHENESDSPDGSASEDEQPTRKRKVPSSSAATRQQGEVGRPKSELWRIGVGARLPPGTQVVIKKPKPRAAGKTPYTPHTIHPNTLLFLGDLKANNDREWFKSKRYPFCVIPRSMRSTSPLQHRRSFSPRAVACRKRPY